MIDEFSQEKKEKIKMSNISKKTVVVFFALFFAVSGLSAEDAKPPEEKSHIGTVTFTQTAGKYTYIKLDEQGKEIWLATSISKVSVGDKVQYIGGLLMKDFHSRAMEKTFDFILLVTRISVLNGRSLASKQPIQGDEYHKNISKEEQTIPIPKSGEIVKVEDGKTIEEIFSEREELKDKVVTIRAKVMKVGKNIVGKNWVTLQDGTGVSPDNKLIATTLESVNISDILKVKGILRTDMNIGAGYKYKILLEDAKFTK